MKVVHVCKMTGVAGTENHLLTLLPELHKRGLDIHLIVLIEPERHMDDYCRRMEALGVPSEQMPIHGNVDRGLVDRLTTRFRELKPDAVHTHLIHADWHGVVAARRAKIGRIYWSGHNDDPFRHRLPIQLIQRYLWRRVTAGIAISEAVRQFMIRVEGAPANKVFTVHYGLQPAALPEGIRATLRAELGLPPDALVFGSVCRLIPQKGLSTALHAFQPHAHHDPNVHYVIVGDGPLRESLTAEAQSLLLDKRVHFIGWRTDAAAVMNAFDVLLMPSNWEGFGLVALEAMAARLPIIASNISALPEIVVNGETGYLVPPGDVNLLSVRMKKLIEDAALRAEMGAAGRARLETDFSVEKMVTQTLGVYGLRA